MVLYNDYKRLVKNYLKSLGFYEQSIASLSAAIKDIEEELSCESVRIANYGGTNAEGNTGETATERGAFNRLQLTERKNQLESDLRCIKSHYDRLKGVIAQLPPEEKSVIDMFYDKGMTYEQIADTIHYSPRTCRRRLRTAVDNVAVMIFGESARANIHFV